MFVRCVPQASQNCVDNMPNVNMSWKDLTPMHMFAFGLFVYSQALRDRMDNAPNVNMSWKDLTPIALGVIKATNGRKDDSSRSVSECACSRCCCLRSLTLSDASFTPLYSALPLPLFANQSSWSHFVKHYK